MSLLTQMNRNALFQARMKKVADAIPLQQELQGQLRSEAFKDILAAGLLAGSLGAGARMLTGANYLFGRPAPVSNRRNSLPVAIGLPTPVYDNPAVKEKSENNLDRVALKAAGIGSWLSDLGKGNMAVQKDEIPWYLPAVVGTGIVGAGGGYYMADKLLDKKRKADLQSEVDAAREQFRTALMNSYDPRKIPTAKLAEAEEPDLGVELDKLADAFGITDDTTEKTATWGGRTAGSALGIYGAMAVPAALLAGLASYRYTKARSSDTLLQEALKRRQREQALRRPPEVIAVHEPVHVSRGGALLGDHPSEAVVPGGSMMGAQFAPV